MVPTEQSIFRQTGYEKQTFCVCATGIDFPLELIPIWKSKSYAQTLTYSHVNIEKCI